jgi:RNA polymerase sigma factor (sigma-70 family)
MMVKNGNPRSGQAPVVGQAPVADLVARAANGDEQAWHGIVERYGPLIWSICFRHRLNGADAEDVVQSVWLHLVNHLGSLRDPAALPGWLITATRRECFRCQRAARPRQLTELGPDVADMADKQAVVAEEEVLLAERHAALRAAFADLPPGGQRLMELLIVDPPLPYAEISARLGIPIGSIGPTRRRLLARLRRHPALAGLAATASVGTDLAGPELAGAVLASTALAGTGLAGTGLAGTGLAGTGVAGARVAILAGTSRLPARCARTVEVGQHGRQAHGEHLLTDRTKQPGHHEPADAGETGVSVGEAAAAVTRLDPVGDLGHVTAVIAHPREAQQGRLAHLEDLAVDDAVPAGLRLRDEPEFRAGDRDEALGPAARAGRGPPRDQVRVGDRPPDGGGRIRVVAHDADAGHDRSSILLVTKKI